MFAVVTNSGMIIPVSNTERGAKCYATRNGFSLVCQVSKFSMTGYNFSRKVSNEWVAEK